MDATIRLDRKVEGSSEPVDSLPPKARVRILRSISQAPKEAMIIPGLLQLPLQQDVTNSVP